MRLSIGDPPEPGRGRLVRRLIDRVALREPGERPARALLRVVVEQQDRRESCAHGAEQRELRALRRFMWALVRAHHAALVRLDADEPEEPLAYVPLAVRTLVLLAHPPERRLLLGDEDAIAAPVVPRPGSVV